MIGVFVDLYSVHDKYRKWKYDIISKKGNLRAKSPEADNANYTGQAFICVRKVID